MAINKPQLDCYLLEVKIASLIVTTQHEMTDTALKPSLAGCLHGCR